METVNDRGAGAIANVYKGCKNGIGGCKIIMYQGGADQLIRFTDSVDFYRQIATTFGNGTTAFGAPQSSGGGSGLQSWLRYYHAPGVGHCGGGVGALPSSTQFQLDLEKWVETGVPPQSAGDATNLGILASGPGVFGTRPVCPWPTTAIYNGSGSTTVASNYTCGGNLDSHVTGTPVGTPVSFPPSGTPVVCLNLHTVYGEETSSQLDYAATGVTPAQCPAGAF